ncbi:MAG TPA: ice-binding family protein [Acidimicrobiia bacterium]|nr:ice-binding family protein [Acidimicrobiia bacterium]
MALFALGPALRAQEISVGLGTADDFAVLAGSAITNTGPTTITGDVGIHPDSAVTGFGSVTLNGDLHVADAVAEQAKVDLVTAYEDAENRTVTETIATELGGQTLTAGVYDSTAGTFGITGQLTLDAQNDPNAVFIFQMATTLGTAAASSVNLINGADACNVFWQVGSSATLGATSSFVGNILALTSITIGNGATVEGRTLARNGAVTLDTNTITRAVCTAAVPEDTTTTIAPATTTIPEDTTTTMAPATTTIPGDSTTTPGPGDTTATTNPGDTSATTNPGVATATTMPGDATDTNLAAPVGGVDTGGGWSPDSPHILLLGGFSLLAVAVGAFVVRQWLNKNGRSA